MDGLTFWGSTSFLYVFGVKSTDSRSKPDISRETYQACINFSSWSHSFSE